MKQIVSLMLSFILIFSCFSVAVFAAEPTITLSKETAAPGDSVTLKLSVKNNPGITAMYLDVRYDDELILESVTDTGLFDGGMFSEDFSSYPYRLSWDESLSETDNKNNGEIAELVFSVSDKAAAGTYYVSLSYNSEEIYGNNLENIGFTVNNGEVTVAYECAYTDNEYAKLYNEYLLFSPGTKVSQVLPYASKGSIITNGKKELNGDSLLLGGSTLIFPDAVSLCCICIGDTDGNPGITAADARLALRYSVELEDFEPWQEISADVDFSGSVTAADARLILRASVGLENSVNWYESFSFSSFSFNRFQSFENDYLSDKKDFKEAGEYIALQVKNFVKTVDISKFNIRKEDIELLIGEYVYYVPSFFYVDSKVGLKTENSYVQTLEFSFTNTAEQDAEIYREEISRLVKLADKNWSDLEIALFYHDYICSAYKYDTGLKIYDAFNLIMKKEGVCQANSLLYTELLSRFGVPVKFVSSAEMVHAWNMVQIDGDWYHVDITWDDPVNDRYGLASHKNFLLSDSKMEQSGHHSWSVFFADIYCTDTKFDNYFWNQSESPFAEFNGEWYYITPNSNGFSICKTDLKSKGSEIISVDTKWRSVLGYSWNGVFSGFGVFNNKLIYNTADSIIALDVNTGHTAELFKEKNSYNCIFGLFVDNGIYYHLNSSPQPKYQDIEFLKLPITGDANSDGYINAKDYTVLLRYTAGNNVNCDLTVADFNGNGFVEKEDAFRLREYIINGI